MAESVTPSVSFLRRVGIMVGRDLRMLARRRRTYVIRALFTGGLVLTALFLWCGRVLDNDFPGRLIWLALCISWVIAVKANVSRARSGRRRFPSHLPGTLVLLLFIVVFTRGTGGVEGLFSDIARFWAGPGWSLDAASMATFGTELFLTTSVVGVLLVAFLAPALTAGAVAQEKERGTLQLLRATHLGGTEIVLGKALGRLLVLYLLIAAGMPVLASCMLLGGVGPAHVVMAGLNLFAIATLCASVGFLFSVLCLRTQDALMASYAVLAAYAVIPPLAHDFVFKLGVNRRVAGWFNPPVAFSIFVGQVEGGESVGPGTLAGWADGLRCLPLCALVSLACFLAAIRLFPAFADGEPTHVWKRVSQRLDRLFDLLNRGLWWVDFRSDPLEGNPVAWKERHFRFLGKTSHLIWAGCLMGIGLCLLYAIPLANQPGIWWERDFHATVLTVMAVLLYVAVTIFASSSIAAEKDRGTWDVLLSSTLYGRHILWGKISGTVRASLLFCVLPVLHLLLSVLFTWIGGPRQGAIGFWVAFAVVVVLFGGALLQLSVGTYFSIRSSSALNAFLWTLGLGLAVNLVVPSVLALLFDDVGPLCMSPTMGPSLVVYGHAFGTLFFSLIYIIVSCALLARMEERFDQLVGRSPSIPLTGALRFRFRRFLPGDKPD